MIAQTFGLIEEITVVLDYPNVSIGGTSFTFDGVRKMHRDDFLRAGIPPEEVDSARDMIYDQMNRIEAVLAPNTEVREEVEPLAPKTCWLDKKIDNRASLLVILIALSLVGYYLAYRLGCPHWALWLF